MHTYNWCHSNAAGIHYIHEYKLQYTWRIPLAFYLPLLVPFCSPFWPLSTYLETLLAVTGSVHLGLRLLVNWPPLPQPFPQGNYYYYYAYIQLVSFNHYKHSIMYTSENMIHIYTTYSPCFFLPLLIPFCSPFQPFPTYLEPSLLWQDPSTSFPGCS
jgi:hypothetical protein